MYDMYIYTGTLLSPVHYSPVHYKALGGTVFSTDCQ